MNTSPVHKLWNCCNVLRGFWLKDDNLADNDNLSPPEVIVQEIVDDLEAALEQFRLIAGDLSEGREATRE